MFNVYKETDLGNGLYSIMERHHPSAERGVMMYLVIGREKAALVDCGFGVTDTLRTFVESLTDLPIICIVAHGHPDHAGAAALFDEIYMNPIDEALLPVSLSYERRMGDVFGEGPGGKPKPVDEELKAYCEEHIVMTEHLDYRPMNDGDRFDLGGKVLEAVWMPGHTQGSMALVNTEDNYALISDCFSFRTAMVKAPTEKRVAITTYRDGLKRFLGMINDDTAIFWGHGTEPVDHSVPENMMKACQEVLDGKTENDTPSNSHFAKRADAPKARMMQHVCGNVMLVYNADSL